MKTKDLITMVKSWNTNLEKHCCNIPYMQADRDSLDEIIQRLREYDELQEMFDGLWAYLEEVKDNLSGNTK